MTYCLNPACRQPQNPDDGLYCQACGAELLLGIHYRPVKLIGRGGFGRTFLAVDEAQRDRPYCVIKQLLPRQPLGEKAAEKAADLFRQEADRLAELGQHPQIPQLLAHFESDEAQYLVQEFIDGPNLDQLLTRSGNFSEETVRDLLADLLPVLRFIHSRQVIHRDIKPENIIAARGPNRGAGHYVLVDFGASKYATAKVLAQTGTVIGSAGYVAPEQAMGKAEFASDLYSLGVTCIHLLTGLHPFDLYSISEDAWVWSQYLTTPVSSDLRRVLDRMLQKATSQRYRSATEALNDLGSSRLVPPSPKVATPREETWACVQTLTGHTGDITAIALSPNSQLLASGSADKTIKLWDFATGQLIQTWAGRSLWFGDGHRDRISALVFSPNGQSLWSGSDDGSIKEWDVDLHRLIATLPEQGWGLSALAFSPDYWTLISGSGDGAIHIWDRATATVVTDLKSHQDQISSLIISPDNARLASSSYDKTIRLWDLETQRLLNTLKGHTDRVSAIALPPEWDILISGSWDKTVKIWRLDRGEQIKVLAAHRGRVNCLAIDPLGEFFASGSDDNTIKLWDLDTAELRGTLRHAWGVGAIAFSPDGEWLVSGSADETIKIWQRPA